MCRLCKFTFLSNILRRASSRCIYNYSLAEPEKEKTPVGYKLNTAPISQGQGTQTSQLFPLLVISNHGSSTVVTNDIASQFNTVHSIPTVRSRCLGT